ncbi:cation transporter [Facklamia sp. DSM 111018]|uniref:Cation transporter n=1 Tax=Facklamia lactis TaxID=2749967 RepID=A0ABS0LQP3_9LACT|nr:cation diffusion facilitator family transporter [Facklamia lactis]MBG9985609.1 cation transporter [Facklamia lactis]
MQTQKKILIAFLLNLFFAIFEFIGGILTGSVAIISDAVHDLGDAMSIGLSYFLERKSKQQPDEHYTYGYSRYSVLGGLITTVILLAGSVFVIFNAITRLVDPVKIDYDGMMIFAVIGVFVNFTAAYTTRGGDSINQKAVNLHMLEDVLGWAVVLVGAIVMRVTNWYILDPLLSIAIAMYIFYNAFKNLKQVLDLFLEKTPANIEINQLIKCLKALEGVVDVHHVHLWSLDGQHHYATMHIVTENQNPAMKKRVKEELSKFDIEHVTIEFESSHEQCSNVSCTVTHELSGGHHHH